MGNTKVTERLTDKAAILETVALNKEEGDMPSPLEKLWSVLWQLKTARNPRKLKSLMKRQAMLDS